jgi:hypothetical protein
MKHVFETYFEHIRAFVSENTGDANLLRDGDFEDDRWDISGGAAYSHEARFSGKRGLIFDGSPASAAQTVAGLAPGWHTLHFFLLGKCGVKIRNGGGKFWDGTAEANNYVLAWKDEPFANVFESAEWGDVFCFMRIEGGAPDELTIEFEPVAGNGAKIDYARLFAKPANQSYTNTIQYEGYHLSDKTMRLGIGRDDPVPGVNYKKASYFDHSYIIGREGAFHSEVYQSLLDATRPRGIQAFVECVEKTAIDDED